MHEQRMNDAAEGGMDSMDRITAIDRRVVRALERAPEVSIPAGFAVRVVGQLPARSAVAVMPARYGPVAMRISMAVLVVALVVLGMRSADHSVFGIALEWILCGQLVVVAMWLGGVRSLRALDVSGVESAG
jgi:hypothetical protein